MDCPYIPDLSYNDFGSRLRSKVRGQRIPLTGSLELSFRCNLRCQHCYVSNGHQGIPGQQELSYSEIQRVLDEITDEGCLWLLLTGGEPLMRRDFKEIYLYAKQKGLLLTIFTNGTMITDEMADFLAEYRPFNLEITLYGFTQETYEKVTGIPGSHKRCFEGIERLVERQIILGLKTVIMTLNLHEFDQMKAFAKSLGVPFRFDGMINAGLDGSGRPRDLRISADQLIQIESQAPQYVKEWHNLIDRNCQSSNPNYLYQCGAGLIGFHIDPYGQLSLCMMARQVCYDLRQGTFHEGWADFLRQERFRPALDERPCSSCDLRTICAQCPGWSQVEHGNNYQRVFFLCEVARMRAQSLDFNRSINLNEFIKQGVLP